MKRSREPDEDPNSETALGLDPTTEQLPSKILGVVESEEPKGVEDDTTAMRCSLPPHSSPVLFNTFGQYELHFRQFHTNQCLECHRNFPSDHLLGVHIEEWHDPIYSCFVDGCERKCLTHQKRRMHMIDKHAYPRNFFFAVTKDGIDGRRSLLVEHSRRRARPSAGMLSAETTRPRGTLDESPPANNEHGQPAIPGKATVNPKPHGPGEAEMDDADVASITGAMSALQFVPPSVRFGRGRAAGFARR
ncbi:hypothetical protein RJ55_01333 [Drechmeria coniospora]|nr:hypothetical protein RJ55_01333 [Drechmeria coniospora]